MSGAASERVRIEVDGRSVEVAAGRTVLQALDDAGLLMNGVDVPHYCWHPGLSIDGSCRLCQVEVVGDDGDGKLAIACNTPVHEGLRVRTKGERVARAREGVMELLLVDHPLDCPICDQAGECTLQDFAFEYGAEQARTREERQRARKKVDLGPQIVLDQERCILCRRCVRFCREVPGTGELGILDRGDRSVIDVFPGERLDNPYSMNVADLCPVGALTTKDFRFKVRVWFLEDRPGLCTHCATGCNATFGVHEGRVQRVVARRNDEVNGSWLCDEGRLGYHEIAGPDRLRSPLVRTSGRSAASGEGVSLRSVSHAEAIECAAEKLGRLIEARGPGVVAGLASPHASNEDLYTFWCLLEALGVESRRVAVREGWSDSILRSAELAANAAGAREIGFSDAAPLFERLRGGGLEGLILLGHDLLDPSLLGGTSDLARLDTLIAIDPFRSPLESVADVVLPARHPAEKLGSYVNARGRVQRSDEVVAPGFECHSEGELLSWLGAALGLSLFGGGYAPEPVSRSLAAARPFFEGADLASLEVASC